MSNQDNDDDDGVDNEDIHHYRCNRDVDDHHPARCDKSIRIIWTAQVMKGKTGCHGCGV